jgi:thioester reductase-like protein
MPSVFLTGFPGFLGSQLVERLLDRYPPDTVVNCLVQRAYFPQAEAKRRAIEAKRAGWTGRICLVEGDITRPDLGLGEDYTAHARDAREIYHLAAVYDLGVRRDLALRVNVDGTRHMLAFAAAAGDSLRRFQYVSTCYVSGSYRGEFTERDLIKGQRFNNHYEETKYLAEVDVQRRLLDGLPATIYRPAVVVGDNNTGETQKFDGPYYLIGLVRLLPAVAFVPVLGNARKVEFNIVPRNYVVDALAYLSGQERSLGQVYQLSDPNPPTVDELIDIVGEAAGRRVLRFPATEPLARTVLEKVTPLRKWTGIEPRAVHYFEHPTRYRCDQTLEDLEGSGIWCPPFASYVDKLVAFMAAHPEISAAAMI